MGGRNSKENSVEHLFPSERTNRLRNTRNSGLGPELMIPSHTIQNESVNMSSVAGVTDKSFVTILPPPASRPPPQVLPLSSIPIRNPDVFSNIQQTREVSEDLSIRQEASMPVTRNPEPSSNVFRQPPTPRPSQRVRISDDLKFMPLIPMATSTEGSHKSGHPSIAKSVPNRPFVRDQQHKFLQLGAQNGGQNNYGNNGPDRGDYHSPGQLRVSSSGSEDKRKLIIRGLRRYKESRGSSAPLWVKEFPCRSRFHPDNYIYDFNEGPNIPKRSTDAMNKCPRKGGRCDRCGIYTGDICVKCRRCDKDCECRTQEPYGQMDPRGGATWTAAEKFLSDLNRFPTQGPNTAPEQYPFNTGLKSSAIPGPPPAPVYFPQPPQPPAMSPVPVGNIYGHPPCYPPSPFGYPPNYGMYPPPPIMGYYPPPPNYSGCLLPAYGYPSLPLGYGSGFDKSLVPPVYNGYVSMNDPSGPTY